MNAQIKQEIEAARGQLEGSSRDLERVLSFIAGERSSRATQEAIGSIRVSQAALTRAAALLEQPEPLIAMPAGTLSKILDMAGTATHQEPPGMAYTVTPAVAAWLRGILSASGAIDGERKNWAIHELKVRKL